MTELTDARAPARAGPAHGERRIRRWVRGSADVIAANRDFLTQLDAAIGDADHGINMDRGFSAAVTDLDASSDLPPGELLIRVGGTLIYRVGGAAGPLFGTSTISGTVSRISGRKMRSVALPIGPSSCGGRPTMID